MIGTTENQILKTVYTWGCEMPKSYIEQQMQVVIARELTHLRSQGLIVINGSNIALTPKGAEHVEANKLVPLASIQQVQDVRAYIRKAIRSILEHDITGYNVAMQEARKTFPSRFVTAMEKFYWNNIP